MSLKRRYISLIAVGIFVPALLLGLWIGGADFGSGERVSRLDGLEPGEPGASFGLRSLPEPDFGPAPGDAPGGDGLDATPREMTRREKMLADFPLEFEAIPPQILEDIDRIAEAETTNSVPPEIMEELEEQLGLDEIVNPNRAIVNMAAQTMISAQRAYEEYLEADQEVPFPSEDELQRMREIRDRSVPTPSQWELLGGRPDPAALEPGLTGSAPIELAN